jgi:hypothetical protein
MLKSNPKSINNLILFPRRTNLQPTTGQQIKTVPASVKKPTPSNNERLIQIPSYKPIPSYALAEKLAVPTIRGVLGFATFDDNGNLRLPPLLQRDLDLMRRCKHPVGLMLCDWLDGNRQFLPDDIKSMAKTAVSLEEVKS